MRILARTLPVALLFALAAGGCEKVSRLVETKPDADQIARIPIDYQGEKVEATVIASGNDDSLTGVRYLRNEDWQKAADAFQKAIATNEKDSKSHFGLGVADEMLKDYANAETEYKAANFWHSDPAYAAGMRRARELMKPAS